MLLSIFQKLFSYFIAIPFLWDFCFIQRIPSCKGFCYSINPSNRVTQFKSRYRIPDLARLANWAQVADRNGQMLALRINKFFFSKFPRCADQTYLDISARIRLALNYVPKKLLWIYFEFFFIFCNFKAGTEKNYIFGSNGHNWLSSKFSWCTDHTSLNISARKTVFSHAPSWNDCEIIIVWFGVLQLKWLRETEWSRADSE